jgi:coiled-coil domain-containing protein 55
MNSAKFSYGLNVKKSGVLKSKPSERKSVFGGNDSDDEDFGGTADNHDESITEFGDLPTRISNSGPGKNDSRSRNNTFSQQGHGNPKPRPQFGDLSSALTSRKYAKDAEELDPNIYDYDAAYDSFKATKKKPTQEMEKKPQYMSNLRKMAEVRDRDRRVAEDKKMQREREEEGDEYADKEKFVTEAYKKQQEENKRLEEEERRREELEMRKNKAGGMTGFYKELLNRGDERHAEIMKAAVDHQKETPTVDKSAEDRTEKSATDLAKEINEHGGSVAINEEGEVVDKRQLLKGGLNVGAKKKAEAQQSAIRREATASAREQSRGVFAGGKQAMRDRQSRMLESQYEQALKRSRDEEDGERQRIEAEAKSRKTAAEVSSAKERYLARKRAEAEAKQNGSLP